MKGNIKMKTIIKNALIMSMAVLLPWQTALAHHHGAGLFSFAAGVVIGAAASTVATPSPLPPSPPVVIQPAQPVYQQTVVTAPSYAAETTYVQPVYQITAPVVVYPRPVTTVVIPPPHLHYWHRPPPPPPPRHYYRPAPPPPPAHRRPAPPRSSPRRR